ncbi:hypothetical protein HY008_03085 [Candidatus Woesebacteria bacterium]|nr:hypothetical protein [Candidatus Woesebacteria bacterium]
MPNYKKIFYLILLLAFFLIFSKHAKAAGSLITSGVVYNADSSANISRSRSSLVRLPENLLNPTQGWVAVRMKMGFVSTTTLSPDPIIWDMSQSDPNDLFVYYDAGSDTFHFAKNSKVTGGATLASAKQTFAPGEFKTITAAWTSNSSKISIDGGAFLTKTTSTYPQIAPFLVGSTLVQGSGRQPNSDYYWVAGGTGTLTDTDAQSIHNFGNNDKNRALFPGNAVFIWWANSDVYNNDNLTTPTLTPGGGVPGDANGDGQVTIADITFVLQNYLAFLSNQVDQFSDGKINSMDFAVVARLLTP